jgi:hypothetical protein
MKHKDNISNTNAIDHKALFQRDPFTVFTISIVIPVVSVIPGSNNDFGIMGTFPMTICTARVSPNARPIAKTTPVRIPGLAAGTKTLLITCHLVAPSE